MWLFNSYQLGNPYILHTSPSNSTKIFKSSWLAVRIMRKILEFGDVGGFRAGKRNCIGAMSTRICERAGMVAVHRLLYDEYEVDKKWYSKTHQQEFLP
jgi:hypothetical protein